MLANDSLKRRLIHNRKNAMKITFSADCRHRRCSCDDDSKRRRDTEQLHPNEATIRRAFSDISLHRASKILLQVADAVGALIAENVHDKIST